MKRALLALVCVSTASFAEAPAPSATRRTAERPEIRAQLAPRRHTTLAAEIGAKVSRIAVPEGGSFAAGQVLVSFDCALQRAQLDKSRAELDGAEKALKANERLLELNSVGELELEQTRSSAARARAEVSANQVLMSKCAITAPFAGRVAEQKVREQQYVQAGQPLLDILDDSVLELEFLVPSNWLAWLKVGTRFEVRIDETGKTYPARLLRIGARVDAVSQSAKVVATIDGRFPELIAGMSGSALLAPK